VVVPSRELAMQIVRVAQALLPEAARRGVQQAIGGANIWRQREALKVGGCRRVLPVGAGSGWVAVNGWQCDAGGACLFRLLACMQVGFQPGFVAACATCMQAPAAASAMSAACIKRGSGS
jgi:hypothetical protein